MAGKNSVAKQNITGAEARNYELVVETPVLAGLRKDLFSFRIFSKLDFQDFKIVNWIPPNDALEEQLLEKGYIKIDYIFPRIHYNYESIKTFKDYLNWIDYFSALSRTIRGYIVSYQKLASIFKITDLKPMNVNLIIKANYYGKTNSPVFIEAFGPYSMFKLTAITDLQEERLEFFINRGINQGFGKVVLAEVKN